MYLYLLGPEWVMVRLSLLAPCRPFNTNKRGRSDNQASLDSTQYSLFGTDSTLFTVLKYSLHSTDSTPFALNEINAVSCFYMCLKIGFILALDFFR